MIEIFHAHFVVFTSVEVQKVGCFAVSVIVSPKPVTLHVLYHMTRALAPVYEGGTLLFLFRLPHFFGALCQCLLNQFPLSHSENSRINGFPYCVLIAALRPGRSTRPNERAAELEFGSNTIATKSLDSRERIREEEGKRDRKEKS